MIEYLDFLARIDSGLAHEKLRVWRQLTLRNGRPIGLYVSGERGKFSGLSAHLFITYIKSAAPFDFERFSKDCLEYALKANQMPAHKQLISSCLIMPCISTNTTYRELVLAAQKAEKISKADSKEKDGGQKSSFRQIAIMPCLLNLTTHKSFYSGFEQELADNVFKSGEEFLVKTVVAANAPPDQDPRLR